MLGEMWFSVLGPLEYSGESGDPTTVSTGQQGRLLAVLLSSADDMVSTDRLTDLLWPDSAPDTARANLQVNVHRLRRLLGSDRIVHTNGSYRVLVGPDEVDATRFESLSASGSHREALALWRGEAYAEFLDLDPVREEAARLEELRLATLADRIDDDLAQGRHTRLVAELQGLVAQHPWREQFQLQLMMALHRSGRSPEALEVFRETRERLVDELGVDPSGALQQLQMAILDGDPSLDLDTPAPEAPPAQPIPAELPAETGTFTGRDENLERIETVLKKGGTEAVAIIAIPGPGGIGKSALAVHAARSVAEEFPDGQLYVNLQGATPGLPPLAPEEALGRMLRSLGIASSDIPSDVEEAAGRLRTLTANRKVLMVLDDAVDDAQVRPLLPGGTSSAVLVTSRSVLGDLNGAVHHQVGTMTPDEATTLLARIAGGERTEAESAATTELARLCDYLPLALSLAGAKLARRPHWPVQALVDRMADAQRRLDELETTDRAVRTSFSVSYDDLSPAAARLFRLVGLLDGVDIGVPVAAALAECSELEAEDLLDELLDTQLAVSYIAGRYHLHDLLRLFARELADTHETAADRTHAIRRGLHCYLATGLTAELVQTPDSWRSRFVPQPLVHPGIPLSNDEEIRNWLSVEADNVVAVARQASEFPDDGPALTSAFAAALFAPLNTRGRWHQLRSIVMLGLRVTTEPEYADQRALLLTDAGWIQAILGRQDEAEPLVAQALDHWREVGDLRGEAVARRVLAGVLRNLDRYEEALDHADAAREIYNELNYTMGQIDCLIAIGLLCSRLGRTADAIAANEVAITLGLPQGDLWHTCVLVGNLADLYRKSGDHAKAVSQFERALELDRTTGNSGTYFEAEHLWGMGASLQALGNVQEGRTCWDRSVTILRDLRLIGLEEFERLMSTPSPETPDVIARQL